MALARRFIGDGAARHGERLAVVSARGRASYADLDLRSDRLASAFVARGVRAGDRIVLFMADCLEAIVAIVAAIKLGAVLTPVADDADAADLSYVFDDCRAAAVVTEARLAKATAEAMRASLSVRLVVLAGGDQGSVSETCLAFEEAVGRGAAEAGVGPGARDVPLPPMLFYPRALGGLGAPITLTGDDVLLQSDRAAAAVGAVLEGIRPMSGPGGVAALLAALAQGATVVLPPCAEPRGRRLSRAAA